jgi:hypothetical protein
MDERYDFGPFRLDCGTRELWRGDQLVPLPPKAFDLLRAAGDADPAISHDGRRVAVSRYDASTATRTLWVLDLSRGGLASQATAANCFSLERMLA